MKHLYRFALIVVSALLVATTFGMSSPAQAKDDSTASDRASAAAADAAPEVDGHEPDNQAPVNNVIPYAIPTDFETAKQQIQRCSNLTDNVLRIQCYDRIALDMGIVPMKDAKAREELLGKFGFWRITARTNDVGEALTSARLASNKPYLSARGIEHTSEFIISCKTQSTDAYIDWKEMFSPSNTDRSKFELVYSLDNQPGVLVKWDVSFDRYATFAPHALDFVRGLHGKKTMVIQGKPQGDDAVTLVFTLDGLENVLKILYDRCYKDSGQ